MYIVRPNLTACYLSINKCFFVQNLNITKFYQMPHFSGYMLVKNAGISYTCISSIRGSRAEWFDATACKGLVP